MKKIEVTPEVRARLREEHCVENDQTVYNALNYVTDSPLARMIRRRALELGGREWVTADEKEAEASPKEQREEKAFCPDCTLVNYPNCSKGIPCCKCDEESCNSRQSCPKGERKEARHEADRKERKGKEN